MHSHHYNPPYNPYSMEPVPEQQHSHHLRVEPQRRSNQAYLISPMKGNTSSEQLYGEPAAEGLIHPVHRRIMANTISPAKLLLHQLGSGQAPIGTPLRSRIDSQESRLGGFPSLKCEESLMHSKADQQF